MHSLCAEGQRYLKVSCTDGCVITYHFTCWRRFERIYRAEHSDFSWKVGLLPNNPSLANILLVLSSKADMASDCAKQQDWQRIVIAQQATSALRSLAMLMSQLQGLPCRARRACAASRTAAQGR